MKLFRLAVVVLAVQNFYFEWNFRGYGNEFEFVEVLEIFPQFVFVQIKLFCEIFKGVARLPVLVKVEGVKVYFHGDRF